MLGSSTPLISIVIPCYNHRAFLERCLNSVANQTYENLEIIILDDCSSDHSVAEIKRLIYRKIWKRRFVDRTKFYPFTCNRGAHDALNYGIQHSSGEIIAILNSDDAYHPDRIELMVRQIQKGHEFAFSRIQYIDAEDNHLTYFDSRAHRFFQAQQNIRRFPSVGFACLPFNVGISTGNFVFTKSLFERVGLFNNYRFCHDWDFLLRAIIYTEPVFLDQDLYYYRFHGVNTFESLQSIGPQESDHILSNYFLTANSQWTPNPVAPSKLNWPGFFEQFVQWYALNNRNQVI